MYRTLYLLADLARLVDKHEVVTVHEMFHEEVEQPFTENRGRCGNINFEVVLSDLMMERIGHNRATKKFSGRQKL